MALHLAHVTADGGSVRRLESFVLAAHERAERNHQIVGRCLAHGVHPRSGPRRCGHRQELSGCPCVRLGTHLLMNVVTRRRRARWVAIRLGWDVLVILLAYQAYRFVRIATESKK